MCKEEESHSSTALTFLSDRLLLSLKLPHKGGKDDRATRPRLTESRAQGADPLFVPTVPLSITLDISNTHTTNCSIDFPEMKKQKAHVGWFPLLRNPGEDQRLSPAADRVKVP